MIELKSIYLPGYDARGDGQVASVSGDVVNFLYNLLAERDETTNISHVSMPDWDMHAEFVLSRPYKDWWLIIAHGERVGAVYLSKANEVGLFILRAHRGKGYGREVVQEMKRRYAEFDLDANINPKNKPSIDLFLGEDFVHIQNTYRWRRKSN